MNVVLVTVMDESGRSPIITDGYDMTFGWKWKRSIYKEEIRREFWMNLEEVLS